MRDVGEQILLRAHETLDALGHLVERPRQLGDLVVPPRVGAVGRSPGRKIAAAQTVRGVGEPLHRARDALSERPRGHGDHQQRERHDEQRTPERRCVHRPRHGALDEADDGARRRIADRRRREGELVARRGDDASAQIAHAHGEVQIIVDLLKARRERGRIAEALADERREMACHARRHLAAEGLAGAQHEDDAGGHRNHEQHTEKVEVDAGVQPRHVSRRPAPERSRRRARS